MMQFSKILSFCFLIFLFSCKETENKKDENVKIKTTTILSRFGFEYYKIDFDETGRGVVKKGTSNSSSEPFIEKTVDDSVTIKIDSVTTYFNDLNKYETKPYKGAKMLGSNRVQIYVNKEIVYDSYRFDSDFWFLIKIISDDIPEEFNPFIAH